MYTMRDVTSANPAARSIPSRRVESQFDSGTVSRYAPAHRFPKTFGIKRVIEPPEKDLAIYFDYEVEAGMDEQLAERVADRFLDTLPKKRFPHFYVHDVYRFLYASYLSERSQPMPPWLVPEAVTASA
jgi:hypothetical protein